MAERRPSLPSGHGDPGALGHHTGFEVAPQGDDELAGQGHDYDPPKAAARRADALVEDLPGRAGGQARCRSV